MNAADVKVLVGERHTTIVGSGALDLTNCDKLRDELLKATLCSENVIVDLRSAVFIDTAVLEYLARAAREMLARDKRLIVIVAANRHPARVLKIVGFQGIMDIEIEGASQ